MEENSVKNVIRDTRKKITYEIRAPKKLNREEMLRQVKLFYFDPNHEKLKSGGRVTLEYKDE